MRIYFINTPERESISKSCARSSTDAWSRFAVAMGQHPHGDAVHVFLAIAGKAGYTLECIDVPESVLKEEGMFEYG